MSSLPGTVLMMQSFKGTICKVHEWEYVLRRIDGEEPSGVIAARKSFEHLRYDLEILIKNLSWQDFETLVDLIFRQAGWQRVGVVGKNTKSWDLDPLSPVTNERGLVQVKSESTSEELRKHIADFAQTQGYARMFYVVHGGMDASEVPIADPRVRVLVARDVAELTINSGLAEWVMGKLL